MSGSPASFFFVAQPLRSQWDSHSWLSPCLQLSGTAVPGCAPLPLFSLAGHDFSRAEEFEESSKLQPRVLHLSSLWNSHSWLFVFDCIVPSFVLCGGAARPAPPRFSCSPDGYLVYLAPGFLPFCGSPTICVGKPGIFLLRGIAIPGCALLTVCSRLRLP